MLKIGSHVGMSGREMLLGSAKEAVSYQANTFMFYTGAPQNTRRKELEKDIPAIYEILKKGSEEAREVAAETLSQVKSAMRINYFEDADLIRSQSERFGRNAQ